ncbi:acyl-CoA thioesterase [Thiopseudomonas alkaliphila]|uniref:Thioesterase n=1 Tax=Thiopseudomonas alkaliphila TaxID=1697053 RepID=A0A0K1XE72_9GAMM|nr:acyl-CoA thioesterase [Thiopseudomonas alkaliphila]AKX59621.1 thioesterase [Thiopseudomonas alkaliphila]MDM1696706.1 acyl-CoA thioesterase [Thiopseudomonas alkaliphila]MDM1716765.1 acyl-CoA thioesterase [Thiopseudomonas alkaliphila]
MRKKGVLQAEIELEIPFFDVDMLEIAWHGHYVKYFEMARCVLLDKLQYNYSQMRDSGYSWPVIDLQVRYVNPAVFGQKIKVKADLVEWEQRLMINYLITDAQTGQRLTRGSTSQVAVEIASRDMQFNSPAVLLEAVSQCLTSKP